MIENFNNSWAYNWAYKEVDRRLNEMKPEVRQALPMYEIIKQFKQAIDKKNLPSEEMEKLAGKIQILSQEKIDYYRSTRFGFVKAFFSSLRNKWRIGVFKSSGELGLELSDSFVKNPKKAEKMVSIASIQKQEIQEQDLDLSSEDAKENLMMRKEVLTVPETVPELVLDTHAREEEKPIPIPDAEAEADKDLEISQEESEDLFFDAQEQLPVPEKDLNIEKQSQAQFSKQEVEALEDSEDSEDQFFDSHEELPSTVLKNVDIEEPPETQKIQIQPQVQKKEQESEVQPKTEIREQEPEVQPKTEVREKEPEIQPKTEIREKEPEVQPKTEIREKELPKVQKKEKAASSLSPQEAMIETFQTIWKHASPFTITEIQKIWVFYLMKSATIVGWKSVGLNQYELTLEKELFGTRSDFPPLTRLVLKKRMKIGFSEERIEGSGQYQQVISFLDKGACVRLGLGWASTDIALEQIIVQQGINLDSQDSIVCALKASVGNAQTISEEYVASLKDVEWTA